MAYPMAVNRHITPKPSQGGGPGWPGDAWPDPPTRLPGVRAELARLGGAEQPGQDAGDEVWITISEFFGGR